MAEAINNRNKEELPRQPEMNPRKEVKAIILHSGTQLKVPVLGNQEHDKGRDKQDKGKEKDEQGKDHSNENEAYPSVKPYILPMPFSQRLIKAKKDYEF